MRTIYEEQLEISSRLENRSLRLSLVLLSSKQFCSLAHLRSCSHPALIYLYLSLSSRQLKTITRSLPLPFLPKQCILSWPCCKTGHSAVKRIHSYAAANGTGWTLASFVLSRFRPAVGEEVRPAGFDGNASGVRERESVHGLRGLQRRGATTERFKRSRRRLDVAEPRSSQLHPLFVRPCVAVLGPRSNGPLCKPVFRSARPLVDMVPVASAMVTRFRSTLRPGIDVSRSVLPDHRPTCPFT